MSKLESLVYDYIEKREIDFSVLHTLIIECTQWPLLERFYYIPILMLIAKNTLGSFYWQSRYMGHIALLKK